MIISIQVTNHLDESITMELRNPESSGFLIQSIDGLNPGKANINVSEISGNDGSIYNSSRINTRNVVFTIGFYQYGSFSIEDIRQLSYKYFPIKKRIKVTIETDNRIIETYGYVEDNNIDVFTKEEKAIISIICPDPYLYDILSQNTIFSSIIASLQFPFSNESLTESLITFGMVEAETIKTIDYTGDLEVGILINIHALGSASDIVISNVDTSESISIDSAKLILLTGSDIVAGDDIYISTIKGNKYAILVRSGVITNIINALGQYPDWFELRRGDNSFTYTAETGLENLQFTISNRIAYEGI